MIICPYLDIASKPSAGRHHSNQSHASTHPGAPAPARIAEFPRSGYAATLTPACMFQAATVASRCAESYASAF